MREHASIAFDVLLPSLAVWISWSDWRRRKIPNAAILLGFAFGAFALSAIPTTAPAHSWMNAVLGMLAGMAWTLPGYVRRQLGAGDVKYAAAIGWLCGAWPGCYAQIYSAVILGLGSLFVLLANRRFRLSVTKVPAGIALSARFMVYLWQYWTASGGLGDM